MSKLSPEEEHYYYTPEGRHEKQGCGTLILAILAFFIFAFMLGAFERCA